MKLAEELLTELRSIDWENCGKFPDYRKWTMMAISKALHRFITKSWATSFVADGQFVNTTNQPTPPGVPVITPTVAVSLTSMPPQFLGHRELYDLLVEWPCDGDLEESYIDQFMKIFVDWLGVLKIGCGQDSQMALPTIPAGTPNVAPPYFHSIDGNTLPSNHPGYTYQSDLGEDQAYPANPAVVSGKAPVVDADAKGAEDGLDAQSASYDAPNGENEAAVEATAVPADTAATDASVASALAVWKTEWENCKDQADELMMKASEARKTGDSSGASTHVASAKTKTDRADAIDQEMLAKNVSPATGFVRQTYPDLLARREAIKARKAWFTAKKADSMPKVEPPGKVPLPPVNEDAPALDSTIIEPEPPSEQTWATSPGLALVNPVQVIFPNYEAHARACAAELQELADAGGMTLELNYEVFARHILACLNDNLTTPGGGIGYCYGIPANVWSGMVNGSVSWSES